MAPFIDGQANDAAWAEAPAITTLDYSSQRPITLRSVHAKGQIYFLVTFVTAALSEINLPAANHAVALDGDKATVVTVLAGVDPGIQGEVEALSFGSRAADPHRCVGGMDDKVPAASGRGVG